jgi:hypothetical protein
MRRLGLGGPVGAVAAVACVVAASGRARRGPADGLLSELGASASPGHGWYRLGLAAGAIGTLSVAGALSPRPGAALLFAAGALIGVATAVPCTAGCPLPVLDGMPPAQDVVHFLGAGAAFACWPAATWACARTGPLRRWSSRATVALLVLLALLGPLTAADRSSPLVGLSQRALALVALTWLAAVGAAVARGDGAAHHPG